MQEKKKDGRANNGGHPTNGGRPKGEPKVNYSLKIKQTTKEKLKNSGYNIHKEVNIFLDQQAKQL